MRLKRVAFASARQPEALSRDRLGSNQNRELCLPAFSRFLDQDLRNESFGGGSAEIPVTACSPRSEAASVTGILDRSLY